MNENSNPILIITQKTSYLLLRGFSPLTLISIYCLKLIILTATILKDKQPLTIIQTINRFIDCKQLIAIN